MQELQQQRIRVTGVERNPEEHREGKPGPWAEWVRAKEAELFSEGGEGGE